MSNVIVTEKSHPTLFKALELISHDRGSGADHDNYAIPSEFAQGLDQIEVSLSILTPESLETFAIGEVSEAEAISEVSEGMMKAHKFLEAFFFDFVEGLRHLNIGW